MLSEPPPRLASPQRPWCRWCGLTVVAPHGSDVACIAALQLEVTMHVGASGSSRPPGSLKPASVHRVRD
jgi:hypothetical protein